MGGDIMNLANNDQFQIKSELERVLHDLQLRLNAQALIIMPAPPKKEGGMPTKKPKIELPLTMITYDDETSSGQAFRQIIIKTNTFVDWSLGVDPMKSRGRGDLTRQRTLTGLSDVDPMTPHKTEKKAKTPASVCYDTGKNVVINNMLLDARFARVKNKGSLEVLSQLCVPLVSKQGGRCIGVLCALNKISFSGSVWGMPFTPDDIEESELFAAILVDTYEGFAARKSNRNVLRAFDGKKGIGGFPKGELLAAAKAANAKIEVSGIADPVRTAFEAEKAQSEVIVEISKGSASKGRPTQITSVAV